MYTGSGDGSLHECDNCGAALPPPDANGTRTCEFCKAVYTRPAPAASAPPQVNLVINAPGFTTTPTATSFPSGDFEPINESSTKKGCGCLPVLLVLLVIAGIAGVPLYLGVKNGTIKLPNHPTYRLGVATLRLPGEPSAPPAVVTTGAHYDNGKTIWQVLRLDGTDNATTWVSAGLTDNEEPALVADRTNVYAASGSTLYAIRLSDGVIAWKGALADDFLTSSCADCLTRFPANVVVKTKDDTLQSFDTATGKLAWSKTLDRGSDKPTATAGARLLARDDEARDHKVFDIIDPATGAVTNTIDPACPDPERPTSVDHAASNYEVEPSAANPNSLYFAFGSNPGCIQRWDIDQAAMAWSVYTPDTDYSFSSRFNLVEHPGGGVFVSSDHTMGIIGPGGSGFTQVANDENVEYTPIGLTDTIAVVRARSTRGTSRTTIQGWSLGSTQKVWSADLGKATSIDPPNTSYNTGSDGSFTTHLHDGKVLVVTFVEGSGRDSSMAVTSFDATTGQPAPAVPLDPKTTDLIPVFGPPQWTGAQLTTRVGDDTLQVIDAATGRQVYVFN